MMIREVTRYLIFKGIFWVTVFSRETSLSSLSYLLTNAMSQTYICTSKSLNSPMLSLGLKSRT